MLATSLVAFGLPEQKQVGLRLLIQSPKPMLSYAIYCS